MQKRKSARSAMMLFHGALRTSFSEMLIGKGGKERGGLRELEVRTFYRELWKTVLNTLPLISSHSVFGGPLWGELVFKGKGPGQKKKTKTARSSCTRHEPTPETASAAIRKKALEISIRSC